MPGYAPQRVGAPGSKAPSTHLATYWWGLEEKVAKVILAKSIGQALGCLERCHGACKADERKRLETRHRDCEVQAFRRPRRSALVPPASTRDEHKHRADVSGNWFRASRTPPTTPSWLMEREQGRAPGRRECRRRRLVVDVGDSSAYAGAVLAKASVDLSDAATVRQTLSGHGGAGRTGAVYGRASEKTAQHRIPRRPETVAEALRDDLKTA